MPERDGDTPVSEQEKKNKNLWFKIFVIVLLIVVIILLLLQRCARDGRDTLEASVKAKLGQLENKSEAEVQAELNRVIGEGMFHVVINADPVFEDGEAEGNLEIENVPNNHYLMRVEIVLDDTGEVVYDSGLIEPNYHIQRDSLSAVLAAGDHPATAVFYAYDTDTLADMGSTVLNITLHISH